MTRYIRGNSGELYCAECSARRGQWHKPWCKYADKEIPRGDKK